MDRIADGVLTTDPVDMQFHFVVNVLYLDRPLRDARLRMTINPVGSMDGILAGYSPVEEIYDTIFGFRSGRDGTGELAPLRRRMGSASGYTATVRHTCNGVYHAMREMADGWTSRSADRRLYLHLHPVPHQRDPRFYLDVETQSVNEELVR